VSVDKITEKILSDAKAEVKRIETEATRRVREIQSEGQEKVRAIESAARQEGERRAQDRQKRDIATAELELRKAALAEKQRLIQKVFEDAFQRLAKTRGEEYRDFLSELLMRTVESGDEEVILSKEDAQRLGQAFLKEINGRLKEKGRQGELRLVEHGRDIQGGFILRQGKRETNCSLAALFSAVREELEPRVAEVLFS